MLPDEMLPPMGGVVYGGAEPSTIIDPGQFLSVADDSAKSAPMSVADLDDADKARAKRKMAVAIAAVEEVIKFIPLGEDRVPPSAFFSDAGRQVYDAEPGRFRKPRLEAVLGAYREVADNYDQLLH